MRVRIGRRFPDEWLGFRVLAGTPLPRGALVELVGAEESPLRRFIAVRRIVDGDYRCYGGRHAGVSAEWLEPHRLRPLTPAAEEFLALFAEPEHDAS
jgi:hypothetical protein